jgi:hypothetical protein
MGLLDDFWGLTLFTMRKCIADKAKCKTQDAIPSAHRLRKKVGALNGRTKEDKLETLLKATGLTKNASAYDLLNGCLDLWWTELKSAIEPYDRSAHETHPRALPIRRKYKKSAEYWSKYKFTKKTEFDAVLQKYKCKDVNFPYLTVVGTLFEVQLANRNISEWPLKSNVFDINDEDPITDPGDE